MLRSLVSNHGVDWEEAFLITNEREYKLKQVKPSQGDIGYARAAPYLEMCLMSPLTSMVH